MKSKKSTSTQKILGLRLAIVFFLVPALFVYAQSGQNEAWEKTLADARAAHEKGNHEEAVKSLLLFLKLSGQTGIMEEKYQAEMCYLLARIYFETGAMDQADENLKKTFDISPDFIKEESNADFKKKVDAAREKAKNKELMLQIEVLDSYRTNSMLDIAKSASFKFSTSADDPGGIIGNIEPMKISQPGYMFLRMSVNLVNNSEEVLFFNFKRMKSASQDKDEILMFLAKFDDGRDGYTIYNVNAPKILPKSKTRIELLSIFPEKYSLIKLQYKNGDPVPISLSKLAVKKDMSESAKKAKTTVVTKTLTTLIGEELAVEYEGEKITVYLSRIIPEAGGNTYFTSTYFDKLPAKVQESARKLGYNEGDIVNITLTEKKGSAKILPAEEKDIKD